MATSIIGFPRIGKQRELKFAIESYFKGDIDKDLLLLTAQSLRKTHWQIQTQNHIDHISSNDFSFYDAVLDTAVLLNVVPSRYKALNLPELDEYFALARGYQGENGDVHALAMKKWFNTNYHYLVPEIEANTEIKLVGTKPFELYKEAKELSIETKPVLVGPLTFLKLANITSGENYQEYLTQIITAYKEILQRFNELGATWLQIDEPILVTDLSNDDINAFNKIYRELLQNKGSLKILLQTYFGDVRDCYKEIISLNFDGIGLDFVEGKKSLQLLKDYGFNNDSKLFAGVVNGKNIWRNDYSKTLELLSQIKSYAKEIIVNTSCSLQHVPYTLESETKLTDSQKNHFSFAHEKLQEVYEINALFNDSKYQQNAQFLNNKALFAETRQGTQSNINDKISALTKQDFTRLPSLKERAKIQQNALNLPLLPTTTIGSFPQTPDVRINRAKFKKNEITAEEYKKFNQQKIAECIALQESIGIDVLVHGEFERNDMVEYFGESLNGFVFTEKAWVQSYGTRCVKPPIVWGDISRSKPITVEYSQFSQTLTEKPVKGMLTGPVTILNWSFPREDISHKESVFQISLAIADEVLDLEAAGIKIIQIDEAALKEKLPLRKADWHSEYLDWAIAAFRLVHSKVKPQTQIHTHMCYSEFTDIIQDIDNLDADVISFEASRSNLSILDALNQNNFKTQVGPGVYDIHSPRVPSIDEIVKTIEAILVKIPKKNVWINPDCGLKTRGEREVVAGLKNLVEAVNSVKQNLS